MISSSDSSENAHDLRARLAAEIRETWDTNQRIHELILEALDPSALTSTLSSRGGRDVARQFAHLHNLRIQQLDRRRARDLIEGLVLFESKYSPSADELIDAMRSSAAAVGAFLEDLVHDRNNRRGFKRGIFTTLSYFVAHESHHRGSILLTLKQSGHAVSKDVAYGIWDWDRR